MALKKRFSNQSTDDKKIAIEGLAHELADRPYGSKSREEETLVRSTISLPQSLLFTLEDLAKKNKRKKEELKSVSAIVRYCIDKCLQDLDK
jgi:hypothetical protein